MASKMLSLGSALAPALASLSVQENLKSKAKIRNVNFSNGAQERNPFAKTKHFGRVSMTGVNVSRFAGITTAPPEPVLVVSEAFEADMHERKINLALRSYRTEELQPYVFKVVRKAESLMLERGEDKEYLPIEGLAAFTKATAELLFGADNPVIEQQRVATIQGLSGTGSLRLGAALIERYFPGAKVLLSSPTWRNHQSILNDARVPWSEYRYYDPKTMGLDFKGMIADIKAAPEGSFILLHGCAHNPTGIDPTTEQWEEIADVIQEKNHTPFVDVAYQGFASGSLNADAASVRLFAARGMELLVAQSYSKNLGLHSERIGAISVVCSSADAATRSPDLCSSHDEKRSLPALHEKKLRCSSIAFVPFLNKFLGPSMVKSQLMRFARTMYSNPPAHGARIVATIADDPALFNEWKAEREMIAGRIKNVRQKLYDCLSAKDKSGKDWSFIPEQIGLFSFTGLSKAQIENMTKKWHVHMTENGRISIAGLPLAKCEYLADAILDSYHNVG